MIKWICGMFFLLVINGLAAQGISMNLNEEPIEEVFQYLNENYNVQTSLEVFSEETCLISMNVENVSIDSVMYLLGQHCNLILRKIEGVYVYQHLNEKKGTQFRYVGRIIDSEYGQVLPLAYIQIGKGVFKTNADGWFYVTSSFSKVQLNIDYLGYYPMDTLVNSGEHLELVLKPKTTWIKEVDIHSNTSSNASLINVGLEGADVRLNQIGSVFQPGGNNNLIYNNLRMFSGVMAYEEPSIDFLVWDIAPGTNRLMLDEMTVFNAVGLNGEIGRINPSMIQNLTLYKGGYDVDHGDGIGSVIEVGSKEGLQRFNIDVEVNNQLSSLYLNVPMFNQKSSLQLAGRASYFNQLGSIQESKESNYFLPVYNYQDFNLKWEYRWRNYAKLSYQALFSKDVYEITQSLDNENANFAHAQIEGNQIGDLLKYAKLWQNGYSLKVYLTRSSYLPSATNQQTFKTPLASYSEKWFRSNELKENKVGVDQAMNWKRHHLNVGLSYVSHQNNYSLYESNLISGIKKQSLNRIQLFIQDHWKLTPKMEMSFGIKGNSIASEKAVCFQPRAGWKYRLNKKDIIYVNVGRYQQFVLNLPLMDSLQNMDFLWQLSNGSEIPVQNSNQIVVGASKKIRSLHLNGNLYRKENTGLTRLYRDGNNALSIVNGRSDVSGGELTLQFFRNRIRAGTSFNLIHVNTIYGEKGNGFIGEDLYADILLGELKSYFSYPYKKWTLSTNLVLGDIIQTKSNVYYRWDAGFKYSTQWKYGKADLGLSVLNVTNAQNKKLYGETHFSDGFVYATQALPFSVRAFVNYVF